MEFKELKKHILNELDELQAADTKEIDVYGITSITDLFIICSGRSTRHVKAIASKLVEKLKHISEPAMSISGMETGEWALIDCGDMIVHIMTKDVRAFYNLEELWTIDKKSSDTTEETVTD
tara:strand:- start:209 stop:571 length:363 start_codon:yes stop_codon:yes gene_type:complete